MFRSARRASLAVITFVLSIGLGISLAADPLDDRESDQHTASAQQARPTQPESPLKEILTQLSDRGRTDARLDHTKFVQSKVNLSVSERAVLGRINAKRARNGRDPLALDLALCKAAERYLSHHLSHGYTQIDSRQLAYFVYDSGGTAPPATVSLIPMSQGDLDWDQVDPQFAGLDATHAGMAGMTHRVTGTRWLLAIFADRAVELVSVPRYLPYPRAIPLEGRALDGVRKPEVWITTPFGKTKQLKTWTQNDRFMSELRFDDGKGSYEIEVMVEGKLGPKIAALFPIHVGAPARLPKPEEAAANSPHDREAAEEYLFEALNRDRSAAGLPKLVWNERLREAARQHSDEMAAKNYVAHVSPYSNEDHSSRLQRLGVAFVGSGENIAAASNDIGKIQPGLMSSPGHRSNIMNPLWTEAGIGVAIEEEENGQRTYYATQLFIQPLKSISPQRFARSVFESLNRTAKKNGNPSYVWAPWLADLAREEARKVAARDPESLSDVTLEEIPIRLNESGRGRHTIAYQVFRILGGQEIVYEYKVSSNDFPLIGVGIHQGKSAHSGDKTVWGVILFANR